MISKSPKKGKILYVCPLAHRGGHRPYSAVVDTKALAKAGFNVNLLTFDGLQGEKEVPGIQHITVLSQDKLSSLVRFFNNIFDRWMPTRLFVVFFEIFISLIKAVFLKEKGEYDIIHLKEGYPFLFSVLSISFFLKDYKWVVHMLHGPNEGILQIISTAKIWKPIYRHSLVRNRFVFLCLTESVKREYEKVMGGLFTNRVFYVPPLAEYAEDIFPKKKARQSLMLPKDKRMLLSFGAFHSGKDVGVVVRALQNLLDVYLVIAGSLHQREIDAKELAKERLILRNHYISEKEKPLYFSATDAVVLSYNKTFLKTQCASMLWEACKFGKPVIASDGGQLGELTKLFQLGLLFEPENELSLRKAILRFLSLTQEEIKVLKNNCKRFCSEFSLESWSKRVENAYENM